MIALLGGLGRKVEQEVTWMEVGVEEPRYSAAAEEREGCKFKVAKVAGEVGEVAAGLGAAKRWVEGTLVLGAGAVWVESSSVAVLW